MPIQQLLLGSGGTEDYGPMDPHPGSWNYDINTLGFMGRAPYYRWRNITTDNTCGIFLKPDGMALYTLNEDGILRRHNMTTAYDLSTAYYSQKVSLSLSSASAGRGIYYKPDGTQFWYLDNNIIKSYYTYTAWDLYSAQVATNHTLDVSSNLTNSNKATSFNFKPDGYRLYVSESDGNNDNYIHQWNLNTAWNVNSSSSSYANKSPIFDSNLGSFATHIQGFNFKSDGSEMYVTHDTNMRIGVWPLSTTWDVTTRGARTSYPRYYEICGDFSANGLNIQWKSDGSKYYLVAANGSTANSSTNALVQFETSSAWTLDNNAGYNDLIGHDSSYTDFHNMRTGTGQG